MLAGAAKFFPQKLGRCPGFLSFYSLAAAKGENKLLTDLFSRLRFLA
ncbi:hypothetical protein SRA_01794 [Streptococcus ratti FA-1 = DSM 20564]|uniref:Uncharacterized protein n=1 Tax=Streptococcus ratti FA-1 = DSM 20564 TaxID=699248 RepID=A0ABP2R0N0_STRRT|nr:hypothetical protein SRA_01794 [Streptococcus ratti FA-1 = DSM 20564]